MRIKVVKASNPNYWYANKIGRIFMVKHCGNFPKLYELLQSNGNPYPLGKRSFIYKYDVKILLEKEKVEFT